MVVPFSPVADGVTNEENAEEYAEQYREPEPENEYREQGSALKTASPISSFDAYFDSVLQTQPIGQISKLFIVLLLKHGWIATPWLL